MQIPFNKPYFVGSEINNIKKAYSYGQIAGDGIFTKSCQAWLEKKTDCNKALLTHSCTAALEIAAILANIQPGDEVIMPSFTFVSTANAFLLRGAKPVFVDIRADTLNIDERLIEVAITSLTRAVVPVHYAGVGCDMDKINQIAKKNNLIVIEDAAQGIMSSYKNRHLGTIGQLGTISFHETKNITSGEGGALLINDPTLINKAEIIREKGTNRNQFFRGVVDKYTWTDIGSSYLPGELIAAFLQAQFDNAEQISSRRLTIWNYYHEVFESFDKSGRVQRPIIPKSCNHNAHMYYLLLNNLEDRTAFISAMRKKGINCVFHYVPLHSSPKGIIAGRTSGHLKVTNDIADRLVRLPIWLGIEPNLNYITDCMKEFLNSN